MSVKPEISDSAYVDPSAVIGPSCVVSPFVFIGPRVVLGAGTFVGPGAVVLEGCEIGENSQIAGEAVVGSRGFGYVHDGREHVRVPQVGRVKIGDRSSIGPATCIDRAALELTQIGNDCKIGALVQIAHNCLLGDDCEIGGGTGLAGSTKIGPGARFGERVGTAGHSLYGEGVRVEDLAGMTKTKIPAGTHWAGHPARQITTE